MSRAVQVEDVFRLILPGSPVLSPDGTRVAFVVKRVDKAENRYVSHLHVMPAHGGKPRQLTHGLVSDGAPAWSPDGKVLAFVSDRGGAANLWVLPLDGGEPRAITQLKGGSVGSPQWSPNGKEIYFEHLAMPKETPEERRKRAQFKHLTSLYHKEDGVGWFRGEFYTIWRTNVATGRAVALTTGDHHDRDPRVSPDGKWVAFVSARREDRHTFPDMSAIFVMDRAGKKVTEVSSVQGSFETPRWSSDSQHLYWVGYQGKPGEWLDHEHSVWRGSLSGKEKSRPLNLGHDRWVANMVGSDTSLGGNSALAVYNDGTSERVAFGSDEDGSYRLYSMAADGSDRRLEVGGKLSILGLSVQRGTNLAAYIACTPRDMGEIYVTRLDGSGTRDGTPPLERSAVRSSPTSSPRRLTALTAPFFKPLRLSTPEEIRFKSDGFDIQGWILKPPTLRPGSKAPALIEIHGGPMTQYGESFHHEMHLLAAQGYVVAYCNPRGSSGRGRKFCNCIEGQWGQDDWNDIQALTDFVAKQPYVDAGRLGILGGSYGGFMVTWAVGHSSRYRAAITMRQAGDFWIHFGSSDFGHYRRFFFKKFPWEDPLAYHAQSPNYFVKNIKTPLLILHQEGDLRCPIAEGEALFTAMKVLDQAPCEMVRFEDEFHGMSRNGRPRNREERLKRVVDWLKRYLEGNAGGHLGTKRAARPRAR